MSDPRRWPQVERLYHAALAHAVEDRPAFLAESCGDDETLRQEVASLLAHQPSTGGFLSRPAAQVLAMGLAHDAGKPLVGRRIGSYEILSTLGVGGMGEVYRAHDSTLGRDVAVKVLPSAFSADPERLARFEREAHVLAALNHPHIGAIYGMAEADGTRGLVLELVEGPTLAERLAQGPTPLAEALAIARQIAEALNAAHEKGIVHRDLKPANIKIAPDGTVKVLDFGIAKVLCDQELQPSAATTGQTVEGAVLGTAAYMSPEQARGRPLDKRSDVWSFGCVLFELLTGQQAFAGDTTSDTIAAILGCEPDWRALPGTMPPALVRLLRRCLEKDAKRRVHDIADARIELDDVLSTLVEAPRVPGEQVPGNGAPVSKGFGKRGRVYVVCSALVTVAVVLFVGQRLGRSTAAGTPTTVMTLRQVTANPPDNAVYHGAISPDGNYVAYTDLEGLHLRLIDSGDTHLLPIPDGFCFR